MAINREPIPTREERAAHLRRTERETTWMIRRAMLWTLFQCLVWLLSGLLLLGWAFHTTNEKRGQVAFYAGILVSDGGIMATLLRAHQRAEREGWL